MSFDHFERGYLLPEGCKDLIDVIGPGSKSKAFLKLPIIYSKPGIPLKPDWSAPAPKGDIFVSDHTTVKELAALLGQKLGQVIADAMQLGIFAAWNQVLGFEAISRIAEKYGYTAKKTS